MLVDVLFRAFRMHDRTPCGRIENRILVSMGQRAAQADRLDTNDHFVFGAWNALSVLGHVYFRILFIFVCVFRCTEWSPIHRLSAKPQNLNVILIFVFHKNVS